MRGEIWQSRFKHSDGTKGKNCFFSLVFTPVSSDCSILYLQYLLLRLLKIWFQFFCFHLPFSILTHRMELYHSIWFCVFNVYIIATMYILFYWGLAQTTTITSLCYETSHFPQVIFCLNFQDNWEINNCVFSTIKILKIIFGNISIFAKILGVH